MRFLESFILVVATLMASLSLSYAQGLDAQQLILIRETSADICNRIEEVRGTRSDLEIQGDVSVELRGLARKFIDAGAETSGRYSEEAFEGLTQEATATALEESANCRERLFLKMFEKISILPNPKEAYEESGRRSDLRTVQQFLAFAPIDVSKVKDEYVCDGADTSYYTRELRFVGSVLRVENREDTSSERCKSGYQAINERTLVCEAKISDLDDVVQIWSGPSLKVSCLSGDCFSCKETSRWKNKYNTQWTNQSRSFVISYSNIHIGGHEHAENGFYDDQMAMARSLARLISGGDDRAFCTSNSQAC